MLVTKDMNIKMLKENPLSKMFAQDIHAGWKRVEGITGIQVQTLTDLAKRTPSDMATVRLQRILDIFEKADMDMIEYATKGKYRLVKAK